MRKMISFTGELDSYGYDQSISISPDAQFNRWYEENCMCVNIVNKTIIPCGGDHVSIIVEYNETVSALSKPKYFEEGRYMINMLNGSMIRCKDQRDVSYMIKDLNVLSPYAKKTMFLFIIYTGNTCLILQEEDYGRIEPVGRLEKEDIVHEEYIRGNVDYSKVYDLGNTNDLLYLDLTEKKLTVAKNNLDISYVINDFSFFTKLLEDYDRNKLYSLLLDPEKGVINILELNISFNPSEVTKYAVSSES